MKILNAYLEDEVREGFFVPSIMKHAWAVELEVLDEVDKVCQRHGINWFAEWGTLLGAVRHHGFVPWDDDIDIFMLRKDYEHFLQVCDELPEGYKVLNYRNHPDFWHFLAKVVAKPRICFEEEHLARYHGFPYIAGIDIFVGDYISADPGKEEARRTTAGYVLSVADAIGAPEMPKEKLVEHIHRMEELFHAQIDYNQEENALKVQLYQIVEKLLSMFDEKESLYISQIPYTIGTSGGEEQHWMPKEWYNGSISMPFENMSVRVPVGYKEILSRKYGEYMCPVRGGGGHEYPFFHSQRKDLESVLNFRIPGFYFSKSQAQRQKSDRTESLKEKAVKAYKNLKDKLYYIEKEITAGNNVDAQSMLIDAQQTAIDLGTIADNVKGEGLETIRLLEQFCEALYQVYHALEYELGKEMEMDVKELERMLFKVKESLYKEVINRREIVFLSYQARYWGGVIQELYKKAVAESSWDVYVLPVPYYHKDYLGNALQVRDESKELAKKVPVTEYSSFDFALHHPDCIVMQNPYDEYNMATCVDKDCYSKNLQRFTENLLYIPYFTVDEFSKVVEISYEEEKCGEEECSEDVSSQGEGETLNEDSAYKMMGYYCNMPGVINADRVLAQSENMRQLYIEKLTEFAGEETRVIWEKKIYANPDLAMKGIM